MENIESIFDSLRPGQMDPFNVFQHRISEDTHPEKIDLTLGEYRDDQGQPLILRAVRQAQQRVLSNKQRHNYKGVEGQSLFQQLAGNLIFGQSSKPVKNHLLASMQTIAGSGAFAIGALFLSKWLKIDTLHISKPSYLNYILQSQQLQLKVQEYEYYDYHTKKLDLKSMIGCLQQMQKGSIVVLQACCHNPTGVDPNQQEWRAIAEVMKERQLIPFFDLAYQGYAHGNFYQDSYQIRLFYELGVTEMLVAQSFSKNFGLYGQRVGALHLTANNREAACNAFSCLRYILQYISNICHGLYVMPPNFGAQLVVEILKDQILYNDWVKQFETVIFKRMKDMRALLRNELQKIGTPGDWSFLTEQVGFMTLLGLTEPQVNLLAQKYHIYILTNSRISVSGITSKNVKKIAISIKNSIEQTN